MGILYFSLSQDNFLVPLKDRKKALALMFEIAFQHGSLHELLHAVIVSLKLCLLEGELKIHTAPLGNIMKRLQKLKKSNSPIPSWEESVSLFSFCSTEISHIILSPIIGAYIDFDIPLGLFETQLQKNC